LNKTGQRNTKTILQGEKDDLQYALGREIGLGREGCPGKGNSILLHKLKAEGTKTSSYQHGRKNTVTSERDTPCKGKKKKMLPSRKHVSVNKNYGKISE